MQLRRILMPCVVVVALALPAAGAPDEELLGKSAGYPIGTGASWFFDESVRVGSFSNLDRLLPHYSLEKAASLLPQPQAAGQPSFECRFEGRTLTLDDFLARAFHRPAADQGRRSSVRALPIWSQSGASLCFPLDV